MDSTTTTTTHDATNKEPEPEPEPTDRYSYVASTTLGPDPHSIPPPDFLHHENAWYNQDFHNYRITEQPVFTKRRVRIVAVGAGAMALQLAHKSEHFLTDVDLQIYDKNDDVGGTWLENRYPGCTCDIPSHSYQYAWARNPHWTSFYSGSPEIWRYFKTVAERFHILKYVKLRHRVESATWDEGKGKWILKVTNLEATTIEDDECEILVNGSGILNEWQYPKIPGIEKFKGKIMHSAKWDHSYDFKNKTVAVIGGGSSSVQIVPELQKVTKKLYPFLRSPVWITTGFGASYAGPQGTNFDYSDEQKEGFTKDHDAFNKYCRDLEGELNKRFTLNHTNSADQKNSRDLVANMMKDRLKNHPELTPHMVPNFALGCRRMTPGTDYLQSLIKENVQVIREDAAEFTEKGLKDSSGHDYDVDAIVCATGFNTNFAPHFKVIGRGGKNLQEEFGDFPKAYMAIMAEGFPNLFLMIGPNGPASHGSILPIFEWHTRYMFQMVNKLQRENIKSFDPKHECISDMYDHTHELMKRLTWSAACSSWFKNGKRVGPVTAIWPGSRLHYFETLKDVRYEDYNITYRTGNRYQFLGNGYTWNEVDPEGNPVWYFDDPFSKCEEDPNLP